MATRMYLPASGAAPISPATDPSWAVEVSLDRIAMQVRQAKNATALASITINCNDGLNQSRVRRQWVSPPLSAQVIAAQTISLSIRASETTSGTQVLAWAAKVVSVDGTIVRGELVSTKLDATAFTTSLTSRTDSATCNAVTCEEGDRLVIEIGCSGAATAHTVSLNFGDNAAADLDESDADTGADNPWIEFDNDIYFGTDRPYKGVPYCLVFAIRNAGTGALITGATAPDSEISKDGAPFADCNGEMVEIGATGVYTLTLTAAEMDADYIQVLAKTTSASAIQQHFDIRPNHPDYLRTGTVAAAAAGTVTLDASARATDDYYVGDYILIVAGTGIGQTRAITDYNGTTKVATISPNWVTTPNTTSTFVIIPASQATASSDVNVATWGGVAVNALDDGDVPVNVKQWLGAAVNALIEGNAPANVQAMAADVITAAAIAGDAINDAELGPNLDVYQGMINMIDDDGGVTDRWIICWFKNGAPVTAGITTPTIRVVKASDGSDLIAAGTVMTQIGTTGAYTYAEAVNRIVDGVAYFVECKATIDGQLRESRRPIGRDSA